MITAAQLRAARALAGLDQRALAARSDGGDDAWVLVPEIAALGLARHVQDGPAVREEEARAFAADNIGGVPVGLHAP